jgi:hypothetical protein
MSNTLYLLQPSCMFRPMFVFVRSDKQNEYFMKIFAYIFNVSYNFLIKVKTKVETCSQPITKIQLC